MDLYEQVEEFFTKKGLLSKKFADYEYRKSQKDMALSFLETLDSKSHIFIEAPTGIGKSFAYLVPAILYAKANQKKAVVSTHTINLQEQLLYKDIPIIKQILPVDFKANLMKGKSNYLCPKRLSRAMESSNSLFESEEQLSLERIHSWAKSTKDGTLSDLNFPISQNVWNSVCAERGICTNKTCGAIETTECFYAKAKYECSKSDILIVNHHLFFTLYNGVNSDSDSAGYLYKNDFIIFDEAQTVENVAAEHIAPTLSREMIKYNLLRLYNESRKKGFLTTFPFLHIIPVIQNLLELNQYFFQELKRTFFKYKNNKQESLTARVFDGGMYKNLLKTEIENLLTQLRSLRSQCKDPMQENELQDYILKFAEYNYIIDSFLEQTENKDGKNRFVYWVESSSVKEDANISICSSPIDLSDYFRQNIFKPGNTTLFTSATLTIKNNFGYFKKRLGAEISAELQLPAQFDFYNNVNIYIPKLMPAPGKNNTNEYKEKLCEWILHFVYKTEGKALVLFTNSKLMNETGAVVKEILNSKGIELLIQGKGISRKHLLDIFKRDINSVLFGLDSFWIGVDVPGEALSNIIITRLPFQVPDHPLIQARMEYIDSCGGNSFMEYSLPEAVLKFRQGIGRLIRTKNDSGIIVILDNRVLTKFYGKFFLDSIEECPISII